jgi:hypothetical protein
MLIGECWALCEAKAYIPFIDSFKPIAYMSNDLFASLFFTKSNLCELLINSPESNKIKKYEFYVFPSNEKRKNGNVFNSNHTISLPIDYYHKLLGFKEEEHLIVRTDLF